MAATIYRLLYRYTNELTDTMLINSAQDEYVRTEEFYTKDHKISAGSADEKVAAEEEKQALIMEGNNAQNPKNAMLFAFDSTQRINHQKWILEKTGYVIRDYSSIISQITPAGDLSGKYVLLNGDTPETADVVAKSNLAGNISLPKLDSLKAKELYGDNIGEYNGYPYIRDFNKLMEVIRTQTIYQMKGNVTYTEGGLVSLRPRINTSTTSIHWIEYRIGDYISEYTARNITPVNLYIGGGYYNGLAVRKEYSGDGVGLGITITPSHIQTMQIPSHYEPIQDAPYMVKDIYTRINGDPWFTFCRTGSLVEAVEKAKKLVNAIGLDNVKLFKEVPIDQKVKIR